MSTIVPPPSKKQKKELAKANNPTEDAVKQLQNAPQVTISFKSSETGESVGGNVRIPSNLGHKQLQQLLNELNNAGEDPVPYDFAVVLKDAKNGKEAESVEMKDNIFETVITSGQKTTEDHLTILFTPQAVFKVKPITRSSFAISGHSATILTAKFSPVGSSRMVTGSGDSTARIWDCDSQTPYKTLVGHTNWVLAAEYSPDGRYIATGSMDNTVKLWDAVSGELLGTLAGHVRWITSLAWKPLHLLKDANDAMMLCSASKDNTIKVWNVENRTCVYTLSGHKASVSCVKWGAYDKVYSGSHDKTINVWNPNTGGLEKTLKAHSHWINHMSLSTDYIVRKGPYTYDEKSNRAVFKLSMAEKIKIAKQNWNNENKAGVERMCTGSDDFTMYLWELSKQSKPLARMHGHQKLVNHVAFSPNGKFVASASFDNSIKLWDALDGKFVATFRGHVGPVYQVCWSSDNRLLVSGSKDTTLKIWDMKTKKLSVDLPGHKDEVYAVDWSVDGKKVVSGGKDKTVRIWSH